jgi:hypothetical protein
VLQCIIAQSGTNPLASLGQLNDAQRELLPRGFDLTARSRIAMMLSM